MGLRVSEGALYWKKGLQLAKAAGVYYRPLAGKYAFLTRVVLKGLVQFLLETSR